MNVKLFAFKIKQTKESNNHYQKKLSLLATISSCFEALPKRREPLSELLRLVLL